MTKELEIPQNFEEKMRNRIRESIGELIDDETLKKLIKVATEDVFLKPRIEGTIYHKEEKPSFLCELIKELLSEKVKEAVDEYINNHPEEVAKTIKEVINLGIGNALLYSFESKFQQEFFNFQTNIMSQIANR